MLLDRERITELLKRISSYQGYSFTHQSKKYAQDRFVLSYQKYNGGNETLEIEINYILRVPLFKVKKTKTKYIFNKVRLPRITSLSLEEIAASKFTALLFRGTPRDLFDSFEIIRNWKLIDYKKFRYAFVFYCSLQGEGIEIVNSKKFKNISSHTIKTQLRQTLRKDIRFNLEAAFGRLDRFINKLLKLKKNEQLYLDLFSNKIYKPELLFDKNLKAIKQHPQVEWIFTKHKS